VHVDWTTFIGPAVIAAVIAAAVSMIVAVINRATLRAMHRERLDLDRDLADRRANADIALAERKVALDRALEAWKRRTEFAEVVLADFYQAQRIIEEARSPGIMRGEGSSRPKYADETEDEARTLNGYFAAAERLNNRSEFFAQLHARRYRFVAYFGRDAAKPYDDLHKIYAEILVAVRMLLDTHRQRDMGFMPDGIQQWKSIIGWGLPEKDTIPARLTGIIEAVEQTCRPVIQEVAQ
jgi:hypothetical protein